MIDNVEIHRTNFAKGYSKFEAGTPAIAQVIGLGTSIDFISSLDLDKIFKYEKDLHNYTLNKLNSFNDISIYGESSNKGAIISFNILGVHANGRHISDRRN